MAMSQLFLTFVNLKGYEIFRIRLAVSHSDKDGWIDGIVD